MGGSAKLQESNLQDALNLMEAARKILQKAGIPYSLDAGTLLGVMRENRLLPWDTDLDFAIPGTHGKALRRLFWQFLKAGYIIRFRRCYRDVGPVPAGSLRLARLYSTRFGIFKKERLMDIFVKYKHRDKYYWVVERKNPILQCCLAEHLDELIPHEFNGVIYNIPKDYDGYLSLHYGDWQVVRKQWDYRQQDGCNIAADGWKS